MTKTLKQYDNGRFSVVLDIDKDGAYTVGLFETVYNLTFTHRKSTTGKKKNALSTFYRYKKEITERLN